MKHLALTPNLNVQDMQRSIRFYRDVAGMELSQTVPEQEPYVFAWMKAGEISLFLNDKKAAEASGEPSAAMSLYLVIEGLQEAFDRARKSGAKIVKEPFEQFYGMREFLCEDPDGFLLIFAEKM